MRKFLPGVFGARRVLQGLLISLHVIRESLTGLRRTVPTVQSHTIKGNYIQFKGTVSALVNETDAIGTVYWNRSIMYPDPIVLIVATFDGKKVDKRNFHVQLYTRNGYEEMKVLAVRIAKPNEWRFAYKIERKRLLGKDYPESEKHDPGFPLDTYGRVKW